MVFQTLSLEPAALDCTLAPANSGTSQQEKDMSKSNGTMGKSGNTGGKSGSNLGAGGGRPSTGFQGGNWPSTTGNPSGGNRGNAPAKGGK